MYSFRKSIHIGENDSITLRGFEAHNKVESYVRPGSPGYGQGLKEDHGGTIGGLVLGTYRTGGDKFLDVMVQGWPPESVSDEHSSVSHAKVTGQFRLVSPLEHFNVNRERYI